MTLWDSLSPKESPNQTRIPSYCQKDEAPLYGKVTKPNSYLHTFTGTGSLSKDEGETLQLLMKAMVQARKRLLLRFSSPKAIFLVSGCTSERFPRRRPYSKSGGSALTASGLAMQQLYPYCELCSIGGG